MPGTLYIVATPIGNLEDVTLRSLRILSEVDIILAEDTRVTGKLLTFLDSKFKISSGSRTTIDQGPSHKLLSYNQHSDENKKLEILRLLLDDKNIALVTDAGTPGISDPGNELIDYLLARSIDIKIVPVPGASAIITALSVSGFRSDKFLFLGFLPKKKKQKLFDWIKGGPVANSERTMIFAFYESPHRILKSLNELRSAFSANTRVCIGRELTKMYEEIIRGNISVVIEKIEGRDMKGEIVVVVEVTKNSLPESSKTIFEASE